MSDAVVEVNDVCVRVKLADDHTISLLPFERAYLRLLCEEGAAGAIHDPRGEFISSGVGHLMVREGLAAVAPSGLPGRPRLRVTATDLGYKVETLLRLAGHA